MKTLTPTLAIFITLALAPTDSHSREWTNHQGRTIEADLIEVKEEAGKEMGVFKYPNGRVFEIPLTMLSKEDQEYARENAGKTPTEPAESEKSQGPSVFKDVLDGKLVALDGRRVTKYEMEEEPEVYAFYYSASWCGPCRQFTPKLISFYNENPAAKKAFEIIFVSSDSSDDAMEEYMEDDEMPWPAVKFRYVERMDEVRRYAGPGIPCLVIVDREGKVLSHSYVNGEYRGPTAVMGDLEKVAAGKLASAN